MKLKSILKGHISDRNIIVTDGHTQIEWTGSGIYHQICNYQENWLNHKVVDTTKTYNGTTVIMIERHKQYSPLFEMKVNW